MATSLVTLLSRAYPAPEWAVFFEVHDATGNLSRRRADAVALGIWPSRGFSVVGFEFKEDRRDWLREKANPQKADVIASKVDQFWVVAGHESVVAPDELPEPWGLLVASTNREKLITKKKAAPYADRDRTTIQRSFVASMLRKVPETTVPKASLQELVDAAVQQALSRTRDGREIEMLRARVAALEQQRHAFTAASGIDIDGWEGPDKIGVAVRAVLEADRYRQHMADTKRQLGIALKSVDAALAGWPPLTLFAPERSSQPAPVVTAAPTPVPEEIPES